MVTEHKQGGVTTGIIAADGRRIVVHARKSPAGGWLIKGHGVCLLDKEPHPAAPNRLGVAEPTLMHAPDIHAARRVVYGFATLEQRPAQAGEEESDAN